MTAKAEKMRVRMWRYGALCLLLAGCSGGEVRETLGLERQSPDEFRVVSRPPLSVPPEFDLRPPVPGEDLSLTTTPSRDQAAALVIGKENLSQALEQKQRAAGADTAVPVVTSAPLASNADAQFLSRIGAGQADPAIRDKLHQDARSVAREKEEEGFIEKILPKKKKEPVVDAKGESERLKKNKDEKKPVTEGETPVVKSKGGVLGNIFKQGE